MMKHLVFILGLLVCSINAQAQETPDIISRVLDQLNFAESEVNMGRATQQEISGMKGKSIVVIPKIAEEGDGYIELDAYILLINNKTGTIEARFVEENAWSSDAYILYDISIQPEPYRLNKETKAFGITLTYETDSRVDQEGAKELSIFAKKDDQLVRVLKDYRLEFYDSISNGRCNSEYEMHSKTIAVTNQRTNQYYDLQVTEKVEKGKSTEKDCESRIVSESKNISYLKFMDGQYRDNSQW